MPDAISNGVQNTKNTMAYLMKPSNFNISNGFFSREIWRSYGYINVIDVQKSWKRKKIAKISLKRRMDYDNATKCCSVSSTSEVDQLELDGKYGDGKGQFGNLVSENGWKVRRMVENGDEMRMVAQVQAEAFHEPVIFFNDLFFDFFKAEVLAGLFYRLRNSPPDRYACLVAEPSSKADPQSLVGVVDVTVLRDDDVLQHIPEEDEYLYVSGIAVLNAFRRQKVATTLLKACDMLSVFWGYTYLVLRAYEDDLGARKLYENAGYSVLSKDPPWMTTWIGRKRRVLMVKRSNCI